jgi:hypothetical protein
MNRCVVDLMLAQDIVHDCERAFAMPDEMGTKHHQTEKSLDFSALIDVAIEHSFFADELCCRLTPACRLPVVPPNR